VRVRRLGPRHFFLHAKVVSESRKESVGKSVAVERLFAENFDSEFPCKSLNLRSPKTLKPVEIIALVPFSTATLDYTYNQGMIETTLFSP